MSIRGRLANAVFDVGAIAATAGTAIVGLLRGRRGRVRDHVRRRGLDPIPEREGDAPCLWLHGVSVGEVLAARRLVERFAAANPGWDVVVSVSTKLGLDAARNAYPEHLVVSFPLDLSGRVGQAFDRLRPTLIAIVEHDLWPNFLRAASGRGVPVALINARLSERSAARYRAVSRVLAWPPGELATICAQDDPSAERFAELGVPAERIAVTGNLKYDNPPPHAEGLREELGFADSDWLLVAGSTHEGEDEMALDALRALREEDRETFLILAPRRTERIAQVARLIEDSGFTHDRWSARPGRGADVLLVDTMGDLARICGMGDLVFVGGTIAPVGGHSVIEPASLGRAIIIGPHYHKARHVVEDFRRRDAIEVAEDRAALIARIGALKASPERVRELGARARRAVEDNLGATERTLAALERLMPTRADT